MRTLDLKTQPSVFDDLEIELIEGGEAQRLFSGTVDKDGVRNGFYENPEDATLEYGDITKLFRQRIAAVAPVLLRPYMTDDSVLIEEGILHDDRFDIRVDRHASRHADSGEQNKDGELVIIKDTPLIHYRGQTLAPSLKGYKIGCLVADILPANGRLLELGIGGGIIGLTALNQGKGITLTGTDIDEAALKTTDINTRINQTQDRCLLKKSDVYADLNERPFDVIVSNPPYTPSFVLDWTRHDLGQFVDLGTRTALDGGADGLSFYRQILGESGNLLKPGGHFVLQVQSRTAPLVRRVAQEMLGRRYKDSWVQAENKTKHQAGAKGYAVIIEVQ